MGSRADSLADELEQRRAAIGHKLDHLARRVEEDASSVGGTIRDDTERIVPIDLDLKRHARERPMTLLLSALGLGTVLGMASESLPSRDHGEGRRAGERDDRSNGSRSMDGGMMGAIVGAASAPFAGAVQSVIEDLARQVTSGLAEGERRQPPAGDGREEERAPRRS